MEVRIEHVTEMHDHWWWRPGWRVGRHVYAVHLPMGDYANLVALASGYQRALWPFHGLDRIPSPWLHLSMQGVGFVDSVPRAEIESLETALRDRLARLTPPAVTFHRPQIGREAVYLPAIPNESIADVRDVVRATIAEALGPERVELAPEQAAAYRPHTSIAYANATQPTEPITAALATVDAPPVHLKLDRVGLLEFHRDHRMYQWTRATEIRIGP